MRLFFSKMSCFTFLDFSQLQNSILSAVQNILKLYKNHRGFIHNYKLAF